MTDRVTVLYNDTCPICRREIDAYARTARARDLPLDFVGLADADLDTWGLSSEAAARRLHARVDGRRVAGLDAFIEIWRRLPRLRWLARLAGSRPIRPLAHALYERALAPLLFRWHQRRMRHRGDQCSPSSTSSTPPS